MKNFEAQVAVALFDGIAKPCGFCLVHADEFAPRVAAAIEVALRADGVHPGAYEAALRELQGGSAA